MSTAAVVVGFGTGTLAGTEAEAVVAPVGNGFVVTPGDLSYILKQIKIAERHARSFEGDPTAATQPNPNPAADPSYCLAMIGSGADRIPDPLTSYGLRTVDGSCNDLVSVLRTTTANNDHATPTFANRPSFGAADQPFPRLTDPVFRDAEPSPPGFPPAASSSYKQKLANNIVYDSQPRLISNLIVDQTSTNPAAVAAAGFPVRAQNGGSPTVPCATNPDGSDIVPLTPANCVPRYHTLFIENVTTDVGLSPPYNSLFTFFGQFFDHGVDQTVKSSGTVIVPLRPDDPLIAGPDHITGNADDLPPQLRFIPLTRAQNQPGPDGVIGTADDVQDANNTDTPWVDQSQTYTSHSSHQVFLREYTLVGGRPVSTGRFLGGLAAGQTYLGSPDGTDGISTWASTKLQAATKLGLALSDRDVTNIPMLHTDPYGNFIPGPARGLPQYVTGHGLVEGDLAAPVSVPADVLHFDTPFLTDIAHNADPSPQDTDNNPATPPVAPVPDADSTPSADFANQPAGTYDDEMLDAHFTCGDGRCNENIALSTIHQIFHSEHNRLADEFDQVTLPANAGPGSLSADFHDTNCPIGCATNDPTRPTTFSYGQRLFQAARFVTEMEYQHLVFEEFARKVQPAVRPFHVYNPDVNPAVKAEFAHAVYRFGHSMLDDDVARTGTAADGSKLDNSLPLLTAFLNPPEYFDNSVDAAHPVYTPQEAAGAIVMGSSDQSGNELDEFINDTLRNNLLGLPLDLATFNLTRARSEGIPPLNDVRRQIFAQTNDGQLAPYTSWADFGQHLKHPQSLVNFVAAYGRHPSITGASTLAAKREAARVLVDPLPTDTQPADWADFMFSTGGWASDPNGVTSTGLDDVDLWVGGLAEITNLFGGLLGSTFNYVFQTQLESLQDFDRLYYLNRTPGMNLRTQLEGNSFSEMIQRNTDGTNTLKADAFATADCKFQLSHLAGTPAGFTQFDATVADDPTTTDCDESLLLLRKPDGTIQYRQFNSVDPAGINGQSVYNGTAGADRVFGGNDNDTVWGGAGNDVVEGNGGDDVVLGGDGNDIITDLSGADVPKGGPGNDAIDGGIGDDIPMGNEGQDFINGGANDNESFAGEGNDFVIAGQGADAVFGDGGDDWIEGGSGQDLLQGDHGAPFFDDPAEGRPGNDIFVGQVGENDYDAEGGDDVMSQNAAVDRNAGAGGFDWAFHQYDTVGADDDMEINNNLVGVPIQVVVNRDRWQETEADSGSAFDDVIRGTSVAPATLGGAGFTGCDVLDQAGVDRISGLAALVPQPLTGDPAPVVAASAAGRCPTSGPIWGDGDILLGGAGNDRIEGRGADDIIDGDKSLRVRISVRTDPADPSTEIGSTDLMENKAGSGSFGPGTAGMTLQQAVFAGLVDPGHLVGVREIVSPPAGTDLSVDTAVFSGPRSDYSFNVNDAVDAQGAPKPFTVTDNTGTDGTDTLNHIEYLQFSDVRVPVTPVLALVDAAPVGTVTVTGASFTEGVPLTATPAFSDVNGIASAITFSWEAETAPDNWVPVGTGSPFTPGLSAAGHRLRVTAGYTDGLGVQERVTSAPTPVITAVSTVPGAPTITSLTRGVGLVTVGWAAPASTGGQPITSYVVQAFDPTNLQVGPNVIVGPGVTSVPVTGLTSGIAYTFQVRAGNAVGAGPFSTRSGAVSPASTPATPTIGAPTRANGSITVGWSAPADTGGIALTGYQVRISTGANVQVGALRTVAAGTTSFTATGLTPGTAYRFQVRAVNPVGASPFSAQTVAITFATLPGAPVNGTPTQGAAGGIRTFVARWTPPANTGGIAITGYQAYAIRMSGPGAGATPVGAPIPSGVLPATARSFTFTVTTAAGTNYRFQVDARNAIGTGPRSARSANVVPR